MYEITLLSRALRLSWDADTAQAEWSPENPARGQCAVSSMVVQDYLGGILLRGVTNYDTVHYWNRVAGTWIDTTRDQFDPDEYIVQYVERPDEYLYKFKDTVERYERLKRRVEKWLG